MAKVLGESKRYLSHGAIRARRTIIVRAMLALALVSASCGFVLCLPISTSRVSFWFTGCLTASLGLAAFFVGTWAIGKLQELEPHWINLCRGAEGETSVGLVLSNLSDEFRILHDLHTPFGNFDHVAVGPTGVFLLERVDWRGLVTPDGKGELLCNGRSLEKPYVRNFLSRAADIQKAASRSSKGRELAIQPLFVFTAARVETKPGTTGAVHCLHDDQLYDYLVETKPGLGLTPSEVETVSQAMLALAGTEALPSVEQPLLAPVRASAFKAPSILDHATPPAPILVAHRNRTPELFPIPRKPRQRPA